MAEWHRYTLSGDPEIESVLDRVLPEIASEIGQLRLPKLRAVVLGGGYGRGEGGVRHLPEGSRLYNDLDFFVFSEGADSGEAARINRELRKISERHEKELGIAVDFGPAKNLADLPKVSRTLMFQELLRGWIPVWGHADLEDWIAPLDASRIPYSEAVRLLLNRGMGLYLAGDFLKTGKNDPDFIVRNLNKAYLGGADALLIAAGKYCWRGLDRVTAYRAHVRSENLPEEYALLYEKAFRWKMEPEVVMPPDPPDAWRRCRKFYLDSVCLCAGVPAGAAIPELISSLRNRAGKERSVKNGLRWLLRSGTWRSPAAAFDPPVVSVLEILYAELSGKSGYADWNDRLYRLWTVFN